MGEESQPGLTEEEIANLKPAEQHPAYRLMTYGQTQLKENIGGFWVTDTSAHPSSKAIANGIMLQRIWSNEYPPDISYLPEVGKSKDGTLISQKKTEDNNSFVYEIRVSEEKTNRLLVSRHLPSNVQDDYREVFGKDTSDASNVELRLEDVWIQKPFDIIFLGIPADLVLNRVAIINSVQLLNNKEISQRDARNQEEPLPKISLTNISIGRGGLLNVVNLPGHISVSNLNQYTLIHPLSGADLSYYSPPISLSSNSIHLSKSLLKDNKITASIITGEQNIFDTNRQTFDLIKLSKADKSYEYSPSLSMSRSVFKDLDLSGNKFGKDSHFIHRALDLYDCVFCHHLAIDHSDISQGSLSLSGSYFGSSFSARHTKFGSANFSNISFGKDQVTPPNFQSAQFVADVDFANIRSWPIPKVGDAEDAHYSGNIYEHLANHMRNLNKTREQLEFFRLEMLSRRKEEAFFKQTFNWCFWFLSDYGLSPVRPILAMLLMFVLFGAGFNYLLFQHSEITAGWSVGFKLSAASILGPFGMRREIFTPNEIVEFGGWIHFWMGVESILGILLIFLIGLALRNQFKMKI